VLGIDYSYVDLRGTRFSTLTNAGGPFNLDLGDALSDPDRTLEHAP